MAKLVLTADGYFKGEFDLKPGVNTIGRGPANDIQIAAGSISTSHCEVVFDPVASSLVVKDLGSTNGTFINGQRVQQSTFVEGQLLRLGDVEMQCQLSEVPLKPRVRMPVPPVPPPVPQTSAQTDTASPQVPAGQFCHNHQQVPATLICKKCGRMVCNACVNAQRIAGKSMKFCRSCGDECISLAEHLAPKNVVEKTFFQHLPGTFAFPLKGDGLIILIAGTIFFGALGVLRNFLFLISITLTVTGTGYLFAYMQSIMVGAGMGEEKPPGYPDLTDFYADVFQPFLLLTGTLLFCAAPALLYGTFADEGAPFHDAIFMGLLALGGLYLPMALLAVGMHGTLFALNPLLIVVSIAKVPLEYLVTCFVLGIVAVCNALAQLVGFVPILGGLVAGVFSLYFIMVEMRILGMLFYSKRRELGWQVC